MDDNLDKLNLIQLYGQCNLSNDQITILNMLGNSEKYWLVPLKLRYSEEKEENAQEIMDILVQIWDLLRDNEEVRSIFFWESDNYIVIETNSQITDIKNLFGDSEINRSIIVQNDPIKKSDFANVFLNRITISQLQPGTIVKIHDNIDDGQLAQIFETDYRDLQKVTVKILPHIDYRELNNSTIKLQSVVTKARRAKNPNYFPPINFFRADVFPVGMYKKTQKRFHNKNIDVVLWDDKIFSGIFEITKKEIRSIEMYPEISITKFKQFKENVSKSESDGIPNFVNVMNRQNPSRIRQTVKQTSIDIDLSNFKFEELQTLTPKRGDYVFLRSTSEIVIFQGYAKDHPKTPYILPLERSEFYPPNQIHKVNYTKEQIKPFIEERNRMQFLDEPQKIEIGTQCMTDQFCAPIDKGFNTKYPLNDLSIIKTEPIYINQLLVGDMVKLSENEKCCAIYKQLGDLHYDVILQDNTIINNVDISKFVCWPDKTPVIVCATNDAYDSNKFPLAKYDAIFYKEEVYKVLNVYEGKLLIQKLHSTDETVSWVDSADVVYDSPKSQPDRQPTLVGRTIQTSMGQELVICDVDYSEGIIYCSANHEKFFLLENIGRDFHFVH